MSINATLAAKQSHAVRHVGSGRRLTLESLTPAAANFLADLAEDPSAAHEVYKWLREEKRKGVDLDYFHRSILRLAKETLGYVKQAH